VVCILTDHIPAASGIASPWSGVLTDQSPFAVVCVLSLAVVCVLTDHTPAAFCIATPWFSIPNDQNRDIPPSLSLPVILEYHCFQGWIISVYLTTGLCPHRPVLIVLTDVGVPAIPPIQFYLGRTASPGLKNCSYK